MNFNYKTLDMKPKSPYFHEFLSSLTNRVKKNIHYQIRNNESARKLISDILRSYFWNEMSKKPHKFVKQLAIILLTLLHDEILIITLKMKEESIYTHFIQQLSVLEKNTESEKFKTVKFLDLFLTIKSKANIFGIRTPILNQHTFPFNKLLNYVIFDWKGCRKVITFIKAIYNNNDLNVDLLLPYVFDIGIPNEQKQNEGQVFTSVDIADFICHQCLTEETKRVIDVACGTGIFLLRSFAILKEYITKENTIELIGIEKDPYLADIAESALNYFILIYSDKNIDIRIFRRDFFSCYKNLIVSTDEKKKTTILMNPPYTRHELLPLEYKNFLQHSLVDHKNLILPKRSGLYVYFIIHATSFLKQGDNFGIIIPNSWLDVDYGLYLRKFLLENFLLEYIINCRSEKFISTVEVNTAILKLIKRENPSIRNSDLEEYLTKFISIDKIEDLQIFPQIEKINGDYHSSKLLIRSIKQSNLDASFKWGLYHRAPENYFKLIESFDNNFVKLRNIACLRRGFTSGANDFFYLAKPGKANKFFKSEWNSENGELYLSLKNTLIVNKFKIQGFKTKDPMFTIEKEYWMHKLTSVDEHFEYQISFTDVENEIWVPNYIIKSTKELLNYEIKESDVFHIVILVKQPLNNGTLKSGIKEYINWGEKWNPSVGKPFNLRPTCQTRSIWYQLPNEDLRTFNILCQMTINDRFTFFYNPLNFLFDARLYGIEIFKDPISTYKELIYTYFIYFNSIITSLQLELLGRCNLGEGGLDIKVYEYEQLKVPRKELMLNILLKEIKANFYEITNQIPFSIIKNEPKIIRDITNNFIMKLFLLNQESLTNLYSQLNKIVQMRIEKAK